MGGWPDDADDGDSRWEVPGSSIRLSITCKHSTKLSSTTTNTGHDKVIAMSVERKAAKLTELWSRADNKFGPDLGLGN